MSDGESIAVNARWRGSMRWTKRVIRGPVGGVAIAFATAWLVGHQLWARGDHRRGATYARLDYGYFATRGAVLTIDRDAGLRGLLIANGNDWSPQPMTMYYDRPNGTAGFKRSGVPDWFSSDAAYNTGVCVGDVNGDGIDDAVVTTIVDEFGLDFGTGGFRIYYGGTANQCADGASCKTATGGTRANCSPTLEPCRTLSREPQDATYGMGAAACALADLDADGDLDLVIAAPWLHHAGGKVTAQMSASTMTRHHRDGPFARAVAKTESRSRLLSATLRDIDGEGFVFLNQPRDGHASFTKAWSSRGVAAKSSCGRGNEAGQALGPGAVAVADVNGDGWLDLIFSGSHLVVYYGSPTTPGAVGYSTSQPDWISADEFAFSPSLSVGHDANGAAFIVTTKGCSGGDDACCEKLGTSGYFAYRPVRGQTSSIWHFNLPSEAVGSAVQVVYPTPSGQPELVAGVYVENRQKFGGPLRYFTADSKSLFSLVGNANWLPELETVVYDLVPVRMKACTTSVVSLPPLNVTPGQRRSVFETPDAMPELPSVVVTGEAGAPAHRWTLVNRGVVVAPPVVGPATVTVKYRRTPVLDLLVTSSSPMMNSGVATFIGECTPD